MTRGAAGDAPVLDLLGHSQKGLLDVGCVLGGCLEEGDADGLCEFLVQVSPGMAVRADCGNTNLSHTVLDNLLARQIGLVADEELVDTLRCVAVDLLEPLLYV